MKGQRAAIQKLCDMLKDAYAELDIWRQQYPLAASYIREEARAKVKGVEPLHQPPVCLGSNHPSERDAA